MSEATPIKRKYSDPDFHVIKLKFEKYDDFEQLIVSHLTRHLDLPGTQLDSICGQFNLKNIDNEKKYSKKFWDVLSKKKEDKEPLLEVNDELVSQIRQLTDFLYKNLNVEGLFRKPGSNNRQQQLMTALGTGAYIDFEKSNFKPVEAAGALKTYLSQLVEPLLIPTKYFDAHLQIAKLFIKNTQTDKLEVNKQKRIECLQLILLLLPTSYRELLRGIINLLYRTAKCQSENKMTALNLSVMFTPHIIWPKNMKPSDLKENVSVLNDHVAFMIRYSQNIFYAPIYIREAARTYFPFKETPSCLSPTVSSTKLVAPSSAVKRTVSRYQESSQKNNS